MKSQPQLHRPIAESTPPPSFRKEFPRRLEGGERDFASSRHFAPLQLNHREKEKKGLFSLPKFAEVLEEEEEEKKSAVVHTDCDLFQLSCCYNHVVFVCVRDLLVNFTPSSATFSVPAAAAGKIASFFREGKRRRGIG